MWQGTSKMIEKHFSDGFKEAEKNAMDFAHHLYGYPLHQGGDAPCYIKLRV